MTTTMKRVGTPRSAQIAQAQRAYRERMRGGGRQRLQEWLPKAAIALLSQIARDQKLSRSEVLEMLICTANDERVQLDQESSK